MAVYRFFLFNPAKGITSAQAHEFATDQLAEEKARALLRGADTYRIQVVECWDRDRLVCRISREEP